MKVLKNKDSIYRGTLITQMTMFATGIHINQYTTYGIPMIRHLMNVCHFVDDRNEELQCIAMGHDLKNFGNDVTDNELIQLGMNDRIINAINDMTRRNGESTKSLLNRIVTNPDSLEVAYFCYRDKYLSCDNDANEAQRLTNIMMQLDSHRNKMV